MNDDSHLESINDKQAASILLQNGLISILENLCSKISTFEDIDVLEEMVSFMCNINLLVNRVVSGISEEKPYIYSPHDFYPRIQQVRQMEIFNIICGISRMFKSLKRKSFFKMCNRVGTLNNFLWNLYPSLMFLQKFLIRNPHFHAVLPPPEQKVCKYN